MGEQVGFGETHTSSVGRMLERRLPCYSENLAVPLSRVSSSQTLLSLRAGSLGCSVFAFTDARERSWHNFHCGVISRDV